MKHRIFVLLLLLSIAALAQETPKVTLEDSSQLQLTRLHVDVKIVGNYATTTYDMYFYNPVDRTLEGELTFPLGQGQAVSKFAMDVNGKLRDAVIVEKELARVAFESTVRQNIDPGLLEKTQGNNYKARIYPILPKKNKHIVITYEQELYTVNQHQVYELPLGIEKSLDSFSVHIEAYGDQQIPKIKNNSYKDFYFKQDQGKYTATLSKQNYTPTKPIIIEIPKETGEQAVLNHQDYFYIHQTLTPNTRLKSKPKKIALLWDASYSLQYRNLEKELQLLDEYFSYIQNTEVQFVSFSNDIHINKTISITQGNWKAIEDLIKNINYDGGTSFKSLQTIKIKPKEVLLFSDGLFNLGDFLAKTRNTVYTINSTVSSNHEKLNTIATTSGGNYINLVRLSHTEAVRILKQETYQFLGIKKNSSISDFYPNENTNVTSNFSFTGRLSEDTTIQLLFGYQGKVTQTIPVFIKKGGNTDIVKRLWAKQKLTSLKRDKKENKEHIISLAKQYHLITDYTSMLILDRIEDYVRYKIEPPQELIKEYKERIKDIADEEETKNKELQERREELFEDYEAIVDWYNTTYPKKKVVKKKKITQTTPSQNNEVDTTTNNTNPTPTTEIRTIPLDSTKRIISGTISEENGPLPGANILIKGTSNGTTTDFDGNFWINAEENDELIISYVGFANQNYRIGNSNTISVTLASDNQLDEVVVTSQGIRRERRALGYAVSEVSSEEIESRTEGDVGRILSGKASGVAITNSSGSSPKVTIRGLASVSSGTEPLYILDGVPTNTDPTNTLNPEEIDGVQVLKNTSATALYGSRGANGVIIITTKKGRETHQKEIQAFNEEVAQKIELKSWNPDTPYIKTLEEEPTIELAYKKYLEIRNQYSNSPSFYLDVSDFFDRKNNSQIAITVLTNLIEVELDNHELMKVLAYKLEYFKEYELAVIVYKKILELRPEEPQSYRDLALAYEMIGSYQESFDLLYDIYDGALLSKDPDERFYGIEHIAFVEITRLINKYGKEIKLNKTQQQSFNKIPVDIRIVIDWNHNDTDIDLWVINPDGEKAYYSNQETENGGRVSEDLTEGYGPEEFMIKNATKGTYKVMVDYYGTTIQKISGPTNLKVTLYTNYGKKNEEKETIVVRLDKDEDEIEVGNLHFGKRN